MNCVFIVPTGIGAKQAGVTLESVRRPLCKTKVI